MRAAFRLCFGGSAAAIVSLALCPGAGAGADPPTCHGVPATITGDTPPGLVIEGTSGDDVIVGNSSQNLILAKQGDDLVCGRGEHDLIAGQRGRDLLFGQGSNDILLGGAREDRLRAGPGWDRLNGGGAFDRCHGGEGRVAFSRRTCERHPGSRVRGLRRLYYLGLEFGRYPITLFDVGPGAPLATNFGYGRPRGTWPVVIQMWSICRRWPGAYPWPLRVFSFRGAKAAWNNALEIYTRRVTIVIFAKTGKLAADAGRAVRDVVGDRGGRLPPPAKGALNGSLPCQL